MRKIQQVDSIRAPCVFSLTWPRYSHRLKIKVLAPDAFAAIRNGAGNFDLGGRL
jgi:hypothetical protein